MSNRWMAILPGLLLAGALAGRNRGAFGGNQQALAAGLSPKDLEGNNDVWQRLGQGQMANGQQPQAGAPMQLPGALGAANAGGDMAAQHAQLQQQEAARRAIAGTLPQPGFMPPAQPYQMPNGLAGGMPTQMHGRLIPQAQAGLVQPRMPMFASMQQRGLI